MNLTTPGVLAPVPTIYEPLGLINERFIPNPP